MADDVEMIPVAAEPPKANNPLAKPATLKLAPAARPPVAGSATATLKPGLKLPPKPGATQTALKPGLKLPTQNALKPGLKLPPKPGATQTALKPGLKLPTQNARKPGWKLPTKPVIRKPGSTVVASPLPKPVSAPVAKPAAPTATVEAKPTAPAATVEAKPAAATAAPVPPIEQPKPMEQLKAVTQKLKGITQEIPQQAILRKTGIIADGSMSDAQKEAAKHKTARISLSDAMGVAPVKNENAPMKTIRIKRPIDIPGATATLKPQPKTEEPKSVDENAPTKPAEAATSTASTITQRKTLKIARPGGGAVRPTGKFGIKRPSQASTVAAKPATDGAAEGAADAAAVADIPEMPVSAIPAPTAAAPVNDGPAWLWTLSALVQAAACVAMGALAWFLYQNSQIAYF